MGTFKTTKETKIAIVPFGHYDGFGLTHDKEEISLHYVLSVFKQFLQKKKTYVRINGRMFRVIGKIGLSHTAVDITGSDVSIGDIASADISPLLINPRIERIYK